MLKLLKKELTLNVQLPVYLFTLLTVMLLIPHYPAIVGVGYTIMQVSTYLRICQANQSMEFSTMLPVRRKDIVTSTTLVIAYFHLLNIAITLLLLIPYRMVYPQGTVVGIDGNLTFVAMCLVCFGLFNLVFIPGYFKTGYKFGFPLLWATIAFVLGYGVMETLVQAIPALRNTLDGLDPDYIWLRAVVFVVAALFYIFATYIANTCAAKRFEKVNL